MYYIHVGYMCKWQTIYTVDSISFYIEICIDAHEICGACSTSKPMVTAHHFLAAAVSPQSISPLKSGGPLSTKPKISGANVLRAQLVIVLILEVQAIFIPN